MKKTESYVTIDSSVLPILSVYTALTWAHALDPFQTNRDTAELLSEARDKGYITIRATIKESHQLGPWLRLNGGKTPIDVVIPWHQIRSIVHSPSGDYASLGFSTDGSKMAPPQISTPVADE